MVTHVHAYHILVKSQPEALSVLEELKKGASFEKMAQLKSTCPSGKNGGDLGWFGRGKMVRAFELVAFNMKKGEISQPIKTEFGWHIIKVVDTK